MYPHDGRTPTNPNHPEEIGVCDRCMFRYPLAQLRWQWDQCGDAVRNLRIRVCPRDYDEVATTLAPIKIIGPEGVVKDPRPYNYQQLFQGGTPAPTDASFGPLDIPDDGP